MAEFILDNFHAQLRKVGILRICKLFRKLTLFGTKLCTAFFFGFLITFEFRSTSKEGQSYLKKCCLPVFMDIYSINSQTTWMKSDILHNIILSKPDYVPFLDWKKHNIIKVSSSSKTNIAHLISNYNLLKWCIAELYWSLIS